jgi:hypothetical protein
MKRAIILLLLSFAWSTAGAQFDYGFDFTKAGTAGLQALKILPGARDAALGGAMVSLTNDATAVLVNPGGLALVNQVQVAASHVAWLAGSRTDAVTVAIPSGEFVFGISAVRFGIEEFEETTVRQPLGTGRMVSAGDLVLAAAAARRFTDKLTIGIQLKYVRESLDNDAVSNVLFDVGAIYYTGFHNLRLGFAIQHFGPDMKYLDQKFRSPLLFRVGAGEDVALSENHHLTTAIDLVHPTDNVEWVNWGIEYEVLKTLCLRTGYRFNVDRGKWSFGGGVRPPEVAGIGLSVDYAYSHFDETFEAIHQFSVRIGF